MNHKLSFRINKKGIIASILLSLIVVPEGLYNLAPKFYSFVYTYLQALGFFIILVWWLLRIKKTEKKDFSYFLTVVIFCVYLFGRTLWQGGDLLYAYTIISPCFASFALICIYKNNLRTLIRSFLLVLEFWIYLNFIFMILYPEGMYYVASNNSNLAWLFGYKSSFQYFILPALGIAWLNLSYGGNKIRTIVLFAVCFAETLLSQNRMLLIGVLLFFSFFLFHLTDKKFATMRYYLIIILIANILFLFFTTTIVNTQVVSFILNIFGKRNDLSHRTIIWSTTLEYIKEHFILGWGVISSNIRSSMYGLSAATHAHNQLLEILFLGGSILLILFVRLILYINTKAMKCRTLMSTKVLTTTMFLTFIMVIIEVFTRKIGGPIWMMIFLTYYCDKIEEAYNKNNRTCLLY